MPLYETIAPYYDDIFPVTAEHTELARSLLPPSGYSVKVLDMGCGTGSLLASLSGKGHGLIGIDDNPAMITEARRRHALRPGLVFTAMDMQNITAEFGPRTFHLVICFGNTLAHLPGPGEIAALIKQVRAVTVENGVFLAQILNYEYILSKSIKELPPIETGEFSFFREYRFGPGSKDPIEFITTFTLKASGETYRDTTPLYPLTGNELKKILASAGFSIINCFGGFDRSALKEDSLPLIAEAR